MLSLSKQKKYVKQISLTHSIAFLHLHRTITSSTEDYVKHNKDKMISGNALKTLGYRLFFIFLKIFALNGIKGLFFYLLRIIADVAVVARFQSFPNLNN